MKHCLNCKKEFEPKKHFGIYCSDSCRVMYHRKKNKSEKVTITKAEYESLLALSDALLFPKEARVPLKKEALSEMISGIKPSGLKFKNNTGAEPYDAVNRSKIMAEIKEWEEKKCPSYMKPQSFKQQKEEALMELKNQLK